MATRIHRKGVFVQEEALAGSSGLYPGMLVKLNSAGAVVVHAEEGGRAEKAILLEDALQGAVVGTVYTTANVTQYGIFTPGSQANVLLEAGQDVAIGDHLISAGNGLWKALDDLDSGETDSEDLAVAMEALDLSESGDVDTLVAARII